MLFGVFLSLAGCTGPLSPAPLSQQLRDACDARECPPDPPMYINCMPIVATEWQPICSTSCRSFLQQSCKIPFAD